MSREWHCLINVLRAPTVAGLLLIFGAWFTSSLTVWSNRCFSCSWYTWLGKVRMLLPKHYSCFISSIPTAAHFSIPVMEQGCKKAVGGSNPCGSEEREKGVNYPESRRKYCSNLKLCEWIPENSYIHTINVKYLCVTEWEGKVVINRAILGCKRQIFLIIVCYWHEPTL